MQPIGTFQVFCPQRFFATLHYFNRHNVKENINLKWHITYPHIVYELEVRMRKIVYSGDHESALKNLNCFLSAKRSAFCT